MRKFSSYGPIDIDENFYVPRQALIDQAVNHLVGNFPDKGGHYITVWAPRQRGKTWIMQRALHTLQSDPRYAQFTTIKLNLEHLKSTQEVDRVAHVIGRELLDWLALPPMTIEHMDDLYALFSRETLQKPLILILDEFDALAPTALSALVGVLRNIYNSRRDQAELPTAEKKYLLHGVALIGVRSVLGVENPTGSPFNVQRSLPIPNLTFAETESMFRWYERESGQQVEQAVIEELYTEVRGHPGLVSWFGELLTETYNEHNPTITLEDYAVVHAAALNRLPNATILNLISKAKQEPHRGLVFELFETKEKRAFEYDNPSITFLYTNGVIDEEIISKSASVVRFASPFVQKRLFNYFSGELFHYPGVLHKPFENLEDTVTLTSLNLKNLLRRYQRYLRENKDWLLKDAPRRSDLRIYEAVFHFNLYAYLQRFLRSWGGQVHAEFPTGNGQIDLIIRHAERVHGLEVKTYSSDAEYQVALRQAARYAQSLGLTEITLAFFVEEIDDANRTKYEALFVDPSSNITVNPVFVTTV